MRKKKENCHSKNAIVNVLFTHTTCMNAISIVFPFAAYTCIAHPIYIKSNCYNPSKAALANGPKNKFNKILLPCPRATIAIEPNKFQPEYDINSL